MGCSALFSGEGKTIVNRATLLVTAPDALVITTA
jgi:hypothetical protein